jgi:flavin reductase (DIM6/NTAB) family NADH-FMN oxidoreductase RutF
MSESARPPAEFDFPLSWAGPDGIGDSPFEEVVEVQRPDVSDEGDDPALALRRTLGMFATGVTVVTTLKGEQVHGMTANAFMSVCRSSRRSSSSRSTGGRRCGLLYEGGRYGVSVLCESQSALSDRFAGRAGDGLPEPRFDLVRETPLVDGALAHFVACVVRS